jgi:hypothetical protein
VGSAAHIWVQISSGWASQPRNLKRGLGLKVDECNDCQSYEIYVIASKAV